MQIKSVKMFWLLLLALTALCLYWSLTAVYSKYSKQNIRGPAVVPLIGTVLDTLQYGVIGGDERNSKARFWHRLLEQ